MSNTSSPSVKTAAVAAAAATTTTTGDWRSDPARRKAVVDAHLAGHKGPLFARWHVLPLARTRQKGRKEKIDFDIYPNSNKNYSGDKAAPAVSAPVPAPAPDAAPVAAEPPKVAAAAAVPTPSRAKQTRAPLPPIQLTMIFDEGDADAGTGWFAKVTDRATGMKVAVASGSDLDDCETEVRWTAPNYAAKKYRPWRDLLPAAASTTFGRYGPYNVNNEWNVYFRADKDAADVAANKTADAKAKKEAEAKGRLLGELERMIAVAACIQSEDLPCANLPRDLLPELHAGFLAEAFKGTALEKLPELAKSTIAMFMEPPAVYLKGVVLPDKTPLEIVYENDDDDWGDGEEEEEEEEEEE